MAITDKHAPQLNNEKHLGCFGVYKGIHYSVIDGDKQTINKDPYETTSGSAVACVFV